MYKHVFAGRGGTLYAVTAAGDLLWNRHLGFHSGGASWAPSPVRVGVDWSSYVTIMASNNGKIYAIDGAGTIIWVEHFGHETGAAQWRTLGHNYCGSGWDQFVRVVVADDNVIYGIRANGELVWHRSDGVSQWDTPQVVDTGWDVYTEVQAGPDGVLYARLPDGTLRWYKHLGVADGSPGWSGPHTVGTGWNGPSRILGSDGVLYVVRPNGSIAWHRHDGVASGADQWTRVDDVGLAFAAHIALRTSSGAYVRAQGPDAEALVADGDVVGKRETFAVVPIGTDQIALKAGNDQYICNEHGGGGVDPAAEDQDAIAGAPGNKALVANRVAIGPWETFTIKELSGGAIALQASNGKYVCALGGGGLPLIANRGSIASWETFTVEAIASTPFISVAPAFPPLLDDEPDPPADPTPPPASAPMKYLVRPLVPYAANAPGMVAANSRRFTIASEQSGLVLSSRAVPVWGTVPGGFSQLDVGVDGTVWAVNEADFETFHRWNGASWDAMGNGLVQISVGSAAHVWGVKGNGAIQRWNGGGWDSIPGTLKQVAVGADGSVWGITPADGIVEYASEGWRQIPGSLKQIAVGHRTMVWGVNASDEIFIRKGNEWLQVEGSLKQVSAAADGSVWGIGADDKLYRRSGSGWTETAGGLTYVAAGSAHNVFGLGETTVRNIGTVGAVSQQRWTGDARQQWRFRPNGDGTFRIENCATVEVLEVAGASTTAGAEIVIRPWSWSPSQRWRLDTSDDCRFRMVAKHSGLVLEIGGLEAGGGAIQSAWVMGGGQRWRIAEVLPTPFVGNVVTLYPGTNYTYENGNTDAVIDLGIGSYNQNFLNTLPDPNFKSVLVPRGLKITLLGEQGFRGHTRSMSADTPVIPESDGNSPEPINSMIIEPVATFYEHPDFQGKSVALGMGRTNLDKTEIGENTLSSLRVPSGVMVTLYERRDYEGERRVYFEDSDSLPEWGDRARSVEIRVLGLMIPRNSLRFGGKIALRGGYGKWLSARSNGTVTGEATAPLSWETFEVVRAGPTQHLSHVSYGDVVALRTAHGTFLSEWNGDAVATATSISANERWVLTRSGDGASRIFASKDDVLSFESAVGTYLGVHADTSASVDVGAIGGEERFRIDTYIPPNLQGQATGLISLGGCGANVCAAEACGADYCGAEACAADAALVSVCAVATAGAAVCMVDAAILSVRGAAAGGVALCGADACGVDVCGAAACGAAACGAAACGADACGVAASPASVCGAAACGVAASPLGTCAAEAVGIDACPLDACGANTCGINACAIDACAVDACAIDIIPLIPGI